MSPENKIELAEGQSPTILTFLLIILVVVVTYNYKPEHTELWLHDHIFQVNIVMQLLRSGGYVDILQRLFFSNFLNLALWQTIFPVYFLFTFGAATESRLGPGRFLVLVLLGATIPWIVQFWDVLNNPVWPLYFEHTKSETYFFGPVYILFTLLGSYSVLGVKKRSREFYIISKDKQQPGELFNRNKAKPINENFGLPSEIFMAAFIIYEIGQRVLVIFPWKDLDTMNLYAVIVSFIIGRFFASYVLSGINQSYQGHPLKLEAIKRYNEMLDLDVDSESAIRGTAMAMGLPDDQVRTWISQNKGRLRTK